MAQSLYLVKIWKMGSQRLFPLYKALLAEIHAGAGDLLLVRVHPPYVTFRVAHAEAIMPVERFAPEELPPEHIERPKSMDQRSR